jgi:hypothetical protein
MSKIIVLIIITGLLFVISSSSVGLKDTISYEETKIVEEFSEESYYIHGNINGPFICLRIPGLMHYIVSGAGGEIYIEYPYFTLYQPGDYFKMIIIGWKGLFMPPLHNGYNMIDREFGGCATIVDFEVR